jgi:hypothetical protein
MHGVPEQLDLTSFIGTTLDHIGLGKHQIQFVFSGDPRTEKDRVITAEGYWEMRDDQSLMIDNATEYDDRDVYRIHRLLSRKVSQTKVNPPESFTLVFDNGWTLTFVDDSSQYESCHIYVCDNEINI